MKGMMRVRVISSGITKGKQVKNEKGVSREEFDYRMDLLELKTEQLDRKISKKADDIVSYQLLQHRHELEELYTAIQHIDKQLKIIESELNSFNQTEEVTMKEEKHISRKQLKLLHT